MNPLHPLFENWMLAFHLYIYKYFIVFLYTYMTYRKWCSAMRRG